MPQKAANTVIEALISQIRECTKEMVIVAKAANKLAKRGNIEKASTILMDIEGPNFEVQELFKTVVSVKQRILTNDS